ncbi:MAG TPA: class I SAM-dependent methyltransferase [Acidobacteriaceae bacterium]
MAPDAGKAGFDRVARLYSWLEYLAFGRQLERCRSAQMPSMLHARHALVLGDGDGRFTTQLLRRNPTVHVVAIDASPAMLALLAARVQRAGASARVTLLAGDVVALLGSTSPPPPLHCAPGDRFDLLVSHFLLDCLSPDEVTSLVAGVLPLVVPGTPWVISEFATPSPWTRLVVHVLYRSFRLLASLRVQRIPPYQQALRQQGFVPAAHRRLLGGLLCSSVWLAPAASSPPLGAVQPTRQSNHPVPRPLPHA